MFKSIYCSWVQIGFCYWGLTALRVMDVVRVQSYSSATPSFPSQPEGKIGLPRAKPRGRLRSPSYPIDGSPPGSPVPGILQARTLDWVAISSEEWMLLNRGVGARVSRRPPRKTSRVLLQRVSRP